MDLQVRAGYRSQITKIVKEANEFLLNPESRVSDDPLKMESLEEELASFLQRLRNAHENLCAVNKIIIEKEMEDKNPEKIAEYEDTAVGIMSRIEVRYAKVVERNNPSAKVLTDEKSLNITRSNHHFKLPKLQLKTFSGEFQEWIPFWENFKSTIHDNNSLTGTEKFNYLQTVLKGEAAKSIAGFTPSDSCYDGAISLLQEEFGDNEKLVDRLMQQLMTLPPVHNKNDSVSLRHLYNVVISSSRSLTALGIPSSHYYIMLKSILLRCMPNELRIHYHRLQKSKGTDNCESGSDGDSTLSFDGDKEVKNILLFLKQEVESIERSAVSKTTKTPVYKHNDMSTAAGLLTTILPCVLCKSTTHTTEECTVDRPMGEKKTLLKKEGRCFRCTRKGHTVKFCRVKIMCNLCRKNHATVVCNNPNVLKEQSDKKDNKQAVNLFVASSFNIYLQTARVILTSPWNNKKLFVRIIIDGGSQRSYVTQSIVDKLNLEFVGNIKLSIIPFGYSNCPTPKNFKLVNLNIQSQFDKKNIIISAIVVPEICFDCVMAPEPNQFPFNLADSNRNNLVQENGIGLMIGADYYWAIHDSKTRRLSSRLAAVSTIFGWTIHGQNSVSSSNAELEFSSAFVNLAVEKMWDLESIGIQPEKNVITKYEKSCIQRNPDTGRYEAHIPWCTNDVLGNNRDVAIQRLRAMAKQLSREPSKLFEYDDAMREFIAAGFAEQVADDSGKRIYYLPHRPVYRPDKSTTKLRIVFDASSHATGNISLNECIWTGSNLLPEIFKILLRFRLGRIAVIADIEKAFLQISLAKEDRDSHRFFWFGEKLSSVDRLPALVEYRMTRVTFGVTCSPFLLSATIEKHVESMMKEYPNTCAVLKNSFYVDDLVCSLDSEIQVQQFQKEAIEIMKRAQMNLRKWVCSSAKIRDALSITEIDANQQVLGLRWNVFSDELSVNMKKDIFQEMASPTKRNVLRVIGSIFDPLGYLAPIVIRLKILFQSLWRLKLEWDEPLPVELATQWNLCLKRLGEIGELSLPRWLGISPKYKLAEIHIFSDASQKAYGVVAFIRIEDNSGAVDVNFLCAKSRVAPLKEPKADDLSLPKLELTATLLAARLKVYFQKIQFPVENYVLWTDSQIAIHWITGAIRKLVPYIANRVREIKEHTDTKEWRHCPGKQNPADFLTRGISVDKFENTLDWRNGPEWLKKPKITWPVCPIFEQSAVFLAVGVQNEMDDTAAEVDAKPLIVVESFSSWKKLLRVTALVLRAVNRMRFGKIPHKFLTTSELENASKYWIKYSQNIYFSDEIKTLKQTKNIKTSSSLLSLNPFLDEEGLLRVGSRLQQLEGSFDIISPIIIPRSSYITKLLVSYMHELTLHGGVNSVLSRLREKFWLVGGRQVIKKVVKCCKLCLKLKGKPASNPFAPLPRERMVASRPFETVGVDFAGPLYTMENDESEKVYVMIFTCAVIRAVHLELVPSLTTESCLLSIRRFIARRGAPKVIYSDNAKTFKRASKDLACLGNILDSEIFYGFFSNRSIIWRFSVERSPWWGGFWERLVKSVKDILKVTIWRAKINNDELITLLAEAEFVINMRPLTYISDDPLDLTPLTPNNFLAGYYAESTAKNNQTDDVELRRIWSSRTRHISFLFKRWNYEYLRLLRSAHHTKATPSNEPKIGDIVLVHDSAKARLHWKMAVVECIFPGRDNKVRAAEVRFADGKVMRRAIQLLYPLEVRAARRPEDVENSNKK